VPPRSIKGYAKLQPLLYTGKYYPFTGALLSQSRLGNVVMTQKYERWKSDRLGKHQTKKYTNFAVMSKRILIKNTRVNVLLREADSADM